jgi:hypothetical protein
VLVGAAPPLELGDGRVLHASEAALARARFATVSINAASSRPRSAATSAGSDPNVYSIMEPTPDTFVHQFQADGYSKIGRHNPTLEC